MTQTRSEFIYIRGKSLSIGSWTFYIFPFPEDQFRLAYSFRSKPAYVTNLICIWPTKSKMKPTNTSSEIAKPKKPTVKPLPNLASKSFANECIKEYKKIITNLQTYQQFYLNELNKQLQILNSYFKEIIKTIQKQRALSVTIIYQHTLSFLTNIQFQKVFLAYKIFNLQMMQISSHTKQLEKIQSHQFFEITLFQVRPPNIEPIKQKITQLGFDVKTFEELNKEIIQTTLINDPTSLEEEKNIMQSASLEEISAQLIEQKNQMCQNQQSSQIGKIPINLEDKNRYYEYDNQSQPKK